MFAVNGNHEYGLSKGPLARARDVSDLWSQAGVTLLHDNCVALPPREGAQFVICGADYLTGGFELQQDPLLSDGRSPAGARFPILLVHEPPAVASPLGTFFPLAFAGHTHGGQLRLPGRAGLVPVVDEGSGYLSGVYEWGEGLLVVSRGIGTSFVPLRLLTRPEATLWRLV
jgi:hypothetical protein